MILDSTEIKNITGPFFKFQYRSHSKNCPEGVISSIYCRSEYAFRSIFTRWVEQTVSYYKEYSYSLTEKGSQGIPITLEEIIRDNNFKVKVLLTHKGGHEVIQ